MRLTKITFGFIFFIISFSCKTTKTNWWEDNKDTPFKRYLIETNKIDINTKMNGKLYDDYYSEFLKYETKTELEKNPYLKVNQVYTFYSETRTQTFGTFIDEGVQSVTFVIYSDEGRFCLSTFDLSKYPFTAPKNGIIRLSKPVVVEDFGGFEITNDKIKTKKRNKTPFKEWYDHVNGYVKNDTIHFTNTYVGKEYKFERKWYALKHKINFEEIYQPTLKAEKFKNSYGLTCFRVTGEFLVK
ncbi:MULTISPECIES: hypothetical protein [Flavobacterium]|nr:MULTISPECIES: hypothetical protein [Flavobacterium]AMA49012.1 hypothetical protein AWN65_05805 [Flavobacterium covae]OWP80052.1 hypothetical protein BWK63_13050 [Flavobacterium covae]POR18217.1 hypothetical protein BWK57_13940 [Flavobacterium columnare]